MVNNIQNNTISEIDAEKFLNLFNKLLNIILTEKTLESQENKKEENEDYENKDKDDDYEYEDHKTIDQNEIIKEKNDDSDKIIDKSKSFEDQIKSLKKEKIYPDKDYDDKEIKHKYFKIKLAAMSNEIDDKLFEKIFGHTLIKLVDKLINTTNKEENQIIVKNIEKSKDKLFEMKDYSNEWVIQPNSQHINLKDAIDLILDFNEKFNYENEDNENENKNEDNENENKNEDNEKENKNEEEEKLRKEYENEKNKKKTK